MTELVAWVLMSGRVKASRPLSLVFIGTPGGGKTELLMRFQRYRYAEMRSDITVRPLEAILSEASYGRVTHLLLTEFNRIFQRASDTSDAVVGSLVQAMEEGVQYVERGPAETGTRERYYRPARLGLVGAMTTRTLTRRVGDLEDSGFLSRAIVVPWAMRVSERKRILNAVAYGSRGDLRPVHLPECLDPMPVEVSKQVRAEVLAYVVKMGEWRKDQNRMVSRLLRLLQGAALYNGRCRVTREEVRALWRLRDLFEMSVLNIETLGRARRVLEALDNVTVGEH
jgi:hypothetical protein